MSTETNPKETTHQKADPRRESTSGLTTLGRLAGAIGLVLLVSAPFTMLLTDGWGALVWGKIGLGAVLVALYLATNADFFSRMAGARSIGLLIMSTLSVVVVLGVVGVVNYVALKNPKQIDLTREGLYTLSEQTTGLLARLKDEVKIYAFFAPSDPSYAQVKETLGRYQAAGQKLSFEMVDPQARVDLIEKFSITDRGPRLVVTARGQDARAKEPAEEELTNAIIKVAEQTSKTVYFLTGHGEANLEDAETAEGYKTLAETIRAEGYAVEPLSLLKASDAKAGEKVTIDPTATKPAAKKAPPKGNEAVRTAGGLEVPANVSVLIVAAPKGPLFAPEIAALEAYLKEGGRLVVLLEPESDSGLATLLKQWKVELHKDMVVDTNPLNRLMGLGAAAPMVQPTEAQQEHAIFKNLSAPGVFMTTRSLVVANGALPGVEASALLESGASAWGETNLVDGQAELNEQQDFVGPVTVAVLATKPVAEPERRSDEARLLVAGDADWLNNKYVRMQGNSDLFVNAVNWLAEEQQKIAIRPKTRNSSQLFLSGEQMGQIKFFSLDILPVLLVALGLGIVLIRRQR